MNQATKIPLLVVILAVIAGGVWYAQRPTPEIPPSTDNGAQAVDNSGDSVADGGAQDGVVDTSDHKNLEQLQNELKNELFDQRTKIEIIEIVNNAIYGKGSFTDMPTGFNFIAERTNDRWELTQQTQDVFSCELVESFSFSKTSIPECWDDINKKTHKR